MLFRDALTSSGPTLHHSIFTGQQLIIFNRGSLLLPLLFYVLRTGPLFFYFAEVKFYCQYALAGGS